MVRSCALWPLALGQTLFDTPEEMREEWEQRCQDNCVVVGSKWVGTVQDGSNPCNRETFVMRMDKNFLSLESKSKKYCHAKQHNALPSCCSEYQYRTGQYKCHENMTNPLCKVDCRFEAFRSFCDSYYGSTAIVEYNPKTEATHVIEVEVDQAGQDGENLGEQTLVAQEVVPRFSPITVQEYICVPSSCTFPPTAAFARLSLDIYDVAERAKPEARVVGFPGSRLAIFSATSVWVYIIPTVIGLLVIGCVAGTCVILTTVPNFKAEKKRKRKGAAKRAFKTLAKADPAILLSTFQQMDKDGEGNISADELVTGLELLGETISKADAAEMLREADTDGSGTVDYREFLALVKGDFSLGKKKSVKDKPKALANQAANALSLKWDGASG